ncbi:MAG: glycosyltransferase family 39 protein [Elusimicrobiota bacterium]|jgi:hypothetical protein
MPSSSLGTRRAELALLLLCAAAYALALGAYYVGFFNDDAFYIIGARSLLSGRFAELNAPGAPPLSPYMPGYPLLLAPLTALFPESFLPLQLLSVACTLGSLHLLWELLDGRASPAVRFAATALAGLNPLTVSVSGTVLTDPLFTLLTLAFFVQARRAWRDEAPGPWALLCGLCAASWYVRPTGAVFGAALVGTLLLQRRPRRALACAAALAALAAPWLLRGALQGSPLIPYAGELPTADASPSLPAILSGAGASALFHLRELYARALFRWPGAATGGPAETLAVLGGLALTLLGLRRLRPGPLALLAAAGYAGLHLLWAKTTARYLLPALPFVCALVLLGTQELEERWALRRAALPLATLALALALFAPTLGTVFAASRRKGTPLTTPPERTFSWIRTHAPPDAVFAAEEQGRVYLLTGRRSARLRGAPTSREFAAGLRARGAGWVLSLPDGGAIVRRDDPNAPLPSSDLRRLAAPPLFEKVFEDPAERSAIYRLR